MRRTMINIIAVQCYIHEDDKKYSLKTSRVRVASRTCSVTRRHHTCMRVRRLRRGARVRSTSDRRQLRLAAVEVVVGRAVYTVA